MNQQLQHRCTIISIRQQYSHKTFVLFCCFCFLLCFALLCFVLFRCRTVGGPESTRTGSSGGADEPAEYFVQQSGRRGASQNREIGKAARAVHDGEGRDQGHARGVPVSEWVYVCMCVIACAWEPKQVGSGRGCGRSFVDGNANHNDKSRGQTSHKKKGVAHGDGCGRGSSGCSGGGISKHGSKFTVPSKVSK